MLELNRVYNTDCLEGIKQIPSNTIKLVVTDPPYFQGMTSNGQKGTFVNLSASKPFYSEIFKEIFRVLKEDGEVYWFCDWRSYAFYMPIFDAHIGAKNMIVWDKISGAGSFYAFTHELLIFGAKGKINKGFSNIWRANSFSSGSKKIDGDKVHPTQKPTELIDFIILNNSKEGDVVLDLFNGSGTTAICARRANRNFIGFELDEKFY